jgi:leucyl/phenylalanyl-tRNA---protein transferase
MIRSRSTATARANPPSAASRGARRVREAVPAALPGPVRRVSRRSLRAASVPLVMAARPLAPVIKIRVAYTWSTPTAPEVITNYTRGLVLFGRSGARWVKFEWRSFPMRAVITQETANVPKNLRRFQRRSKMEVRFDQDFEAIIGACQEGRTGWIWITPALIDVYREVRSLGFVRTVGTYRSGQLVGGLWGIGLGRVFGVMSMFHREDYAGSLAVAALVDAVSSEGRWSVIDFGVLTPNFTMYGAREISLERFREIIWSNLT